MSVMSFGGERLSQLLNNGLLKSNSMYNSAESGSAKPTILRKRAFPQLDDNSVAVKSRVLSERRPLAVIQEENPDSPNVFTCLTPVKTSPQRMLEFSPSQFLNTPRVQSLRRKTSTPHRSVSGDFDTITDATFYTSNVNTPLSSLDRMSPRTFITPSAQSPDSLDFDPIMKLGDSRISGDNTLVKDSIDENSYPATPIKNALEKIQKEAVLLKRLTSSIDSHDATSRQTLDTLKRNIDAGYGSLGSVCSLTLERRPSSAACRSLLQGLPPKNFQPKLFPEPSPWFDDPETPGKSLIGDASLALSPSPSLVRARSALDEISLNDGYAHDDIHSSPPLKPIKPPSLSPVSPFGKPLQDTALQSGATNMWTLRDSQSENSSPKLSRKEVKFNPAWLAVACGRSMVAVCMAEKARLLLRLNGHSVNSGPYRSAPSFPYVPVLVEK